MNLLDVVIQLIDLSGFMSKRYPAGLKKKKRKTNKGNDHNYQMEEYILSRSTAG